MKILALVLVCLYPHAKAVPKFRIGQVVAVAMPAATTEYFKIGYIDPQLENDGRIHFRYTDAQRKIGGEWPEESLRALTAAECGR